MISTFGAMFAPDQEKTAAELLRVCRSGGKIGMANWPPRGPVGGGLFKTIAEHAPPPPGHPARRALGDRRPAQGAVRRRCVGAHAQRASPEFRYRSPEHWLAFFREFFGPMMMAFERVGEEGAPALENDLLAVVREANRAGDAALVAPAEYVEVVAVRA